MARRADHTPTELRSLALNKGLEIVDKNGLSTLTARKLAVSIGYTPGTIYHAFGSLDSYYLHLAMHAATLWKEELVTKLARTRKSRIEALAHAYIDFAQQHKNRWQLIFAYTASPKTALPAGYLDCMSSLLGMIDTALTDFQQDPRKRHRLAKALWAAIHGICALEHSRMLAHSPGSSAQELAKELLDLLSAE